MRTKHNVNKWAEQCRPLLLYIVDSLWSIINILITPNFR